MLNSQRGNQFPISTGDRTRLHDQGSVRLTPESFDRTLDVGRTLYVGWSQAHPNRRGGRLDSAPQRDMRRLLKIKKDRHAAYLGRHLLEHLQDLAADGELARRESGDVAVRPRQARDKSAANWIVDCREDDGN